MNKFQKALLIAGAVLIIAMGLLSRGLKKPPPATEDDQKPNAPPVTALIRANVDSAISRRKAKIKPVETPEPDFDPYEEWELTKIFDHFMVPPGRFEAADVRDSLVQLGVLYNLHGGKGGLSFNKRTSFAPDHAIAFDHGNISFRQLLGIVAAHGRFKIDISEGILTLNPLGDPNAPREATVRVPPNFVSGPAPVIGPFGDPEPQPEFVPGRAFEEFGIVFGDEIEINPDPATSTWNLVGDPAEIARVESLVRAMAHGVQTQVFITQKLITTDAGLAFDPQTYATDAESQVAIREMNQTPGVTLLSAPSIVTSAGQRARVEIAREITYPLSDDPTEFELRHVGFWIDTTPILAGLDRVQLQGATEFTTAGDQRLADVVALTGDTDPPTATDENDFRTHATDFDGQLIEGNTAFIETAQEDGTTVYQFITVRRLDPAGQPILGNN